jgi:hypothetical protein
LQAAVWIYDSPATNGDTTCGPSDAAGRIYQAAGIKKKVEMTTPNEMPNKPPTDWLAWSLQMALGFVVGFGASFPIARLLFRFGLISFDQMFLAMVGGAICCGAFASYYGDRAWIKPSFFDSPEPPRTEQGRKWSIMTGILGGSLVFISIGMHLITAGGPSGRPSSGGFSFFTLLLAAIPAFLLFHALRTGTGFWRFGTLDREETPLLFWIYVAAMALGVFCFLFGR